MLCEWSCQGQFLLTTSSQRSVVLWELSQTAPEKTKQGSYDNLSTTPSSFKIRSLWSIDVDHEIQQAIYIPASSSPSSLTTTATNSNNANTTSSLTGTGDANAALPVR